MLIWYIVGVILAIVLICFVLRVNKTPITIKDASRIIIFSALSWLGFILFLSLLCIMWYDEHKNDRIF